MHQLILENLNLIKRVMTNEASSIIILLLPFAKLIKILESGNCSFCYSSHLIDQTIERSSDIVKDFPHLQPIQEDLISCLNERSSFRRTKIIFSFSILEIIMKTKLITF